MFIYAYLLNGVTPVSNVESYDNVQLNGNIPIVIATSLPDNYEDISSIRNWWKYGTNLNKDYKFIRREIMNMVSSVGWLNITPEEKIIAATIFAVGKTERAVIFNIEDQILNGIIFHKQSVKSRVTRENRAVSEIYNRLTPGDQADLLNDISNLIDIYVKFGIEGTLEGDPEGLFDYLESRSNTSYATTGLLSKNYSVEGMTINQLSNTLIDILKNGNY